MGSCTLYKLDIQSVLCVSWRPSCICLHCHNTARWSCWLSPVALPEHAFSRCTFRTSPFPSFSGPDIVRNAALSAARRSLLAAGAPQLQPITTSNLAPQLKGPRVSRFTYVMEEAKSSGRLKQQGEPNISSTAAVVSDDSPPRFKQGERVIVLGRDLDGCLSYRTATVTLVRMIVSLACCRLKVSVLVVHDV